MEQPADTSPSLRDMAALMRKPVEPYWISRLLFRPWTVYLSAILGRAGLSPNAITALSGISLAIGAALLALDAPLAWAIGGVMVFLYFTLDHCDGEVARYNAVTRHSPGGPEGIFWDGVAHGLSPLLILAVGYRLQMEGSFGFWPMVLAVLGVTAGCIVPWQRSCEAVLVWSNRHRRKGNFIQVPAWFMESGDDDDAPPAAGWWPALKQFVLFPGTFVTLPVAAILDATIGPLPLTSGPEAPTLHWVALWLLQICGGSILASANGSRRHGRRLRALADEEIPELDA